jgi:hypothetical protein
VGELTLGRQELTLKSQVLLPISKSRPTLLPSRDGRRWSNQLEDEQLHFPLQTSSNIAQ